MTPKLASRLALAPVLGLVLVLAAPAPAASAATAAEAPASCSIPQSPRDLRATPPGSPYFLTSDNSIVTDATADSLVYLPRLGGMPQKLLRCGQHYHFPIETPQGCSAKPAAGRTAVKPGDWIEVHTVYAAKVKPGNCDPETLCCCEAGPFLVRAFEAKVTAGGRGGPIVPPGGRPLAEWSGSTTGPDYGPGCTTEVPPGAPPAAVDKTAASGDLPPECKPAALWSFRLGCGFQVSEEQLKAFRHADKPRDLQPAARLSRDLTRVHGTPRR